MAKERLYNKITASCTDEEKDRWLVAVGQQNASIVLRRIIREYCIEQEMMKEDLKKLNLNGSTQTSGHNH